VLPATTFFAKENLYWPYVLYNEDGSEIPQSVADANIIKSIQRGATTNSAVYQVNVTINAVDMNKSFISSSTTSGTYNNTEARLASVQLTTPTNLLFQGGSSTGSITTAWEVIEYV
jgi:hypothetical protein